MVGVLRPARRVALVAILVLASSYVAGYRFGQASEGVVRRATAPAAEQAAHADPAAVAERATAGGRAGAQEPEVPARVAATQPFTGPGRPPLPRSKSGPFGSRPTTGAEYLALTFDDGPDPRWTPQVLELLRQHRVLATFCVVGELAAAYPDLIQEIAADGHTLCNHSWGHDVGLGSRSREQIRRDLNRTTAAIRAAVPQARVSYYRQPGGAWTRAVVDVAEELGMSSLHWTVDPQDWERPSAAAIAGQVTAGASKGAIVLLHDGGGERAGTVAAVERMLPELTRRFELDGLPPGIDLPRRHGLELPARPAQR